MTNARALALIAVAFLAGAYGEWEIYPRAESYLYRNDYAKLWREEGGRNKNWDVSIIGDADGGKERGMEAFYRVSIPDCLASSDPHPMQQQNTGGNQ